MHSEASTAGARLIVDLEAVCSNWRTLGARAAPAECSAVVKADAYGLGAAEVAQALYRAGCRTFFVALFSEGLALRDVLPGDAGVLILNGLLPGTEDRCAQASLTPVLNSLDQVHAWRAAAARAGRPLAAALQSDSGMSRLGLAEPEWRWLAGTPAELAGVDVQLVMSHLASAELPDALLNRSQLAQFREFRAAWPAARASLANSSGVFLGPDFHFDLLRPGAALYGVAPNALLANPMQPVIRMQARLLQCRGIAAGDRVGYNHTWTADRDSRIATLAVGYADGYPRDLSNRAVVSLAGQQVPLVGRVSMDTLTIDVTDLPPEQLVPGTWFDLVNGQHDINVLARLADASAYELLTRLGRRFERVYLPSGDAAHGQREGGVAAAA